MPTPGLNAQSFASPAWMSVYKVSFGTEVRKAFGKCRRAGSTPHACRFQRCGPGPGRQSDRKSTRLNSSHRCISYAVFCLKKKKKDHAPDAHGKGWVSDGNGMPRVALSSGRPSRWCRDLAVLTSTFS